MALEGVAARPSARCSISKSLPLSSELERVSSLGAINLVKSSLYINNRQPYGSLSNALRSQHAAVVVDMVVEGRVGGDDVGVPSSSRGDTS